MAECDINDMSNEKKFKAVYPNASIERQRTNGGDTYYLVRKTPREFMWTGSGKTKAKAWENAASKLPAA